MKVSIVIPTKNRSKELARFIYSLNKQTVIPKELIIADASIRNNKVQIRKALSIKISLVYIHTPESPGTNYQRNKGLKNSQGEISFIFDDDIVLNPGYIEETMKVYAEHDKCDGVVGRITNIYPPKTSFGRFKVALMNFLYYFWQLSYFSTDGKIRMSGLPTYPFRSKKISRTTMMCAGCMSAKTSILKKYKFDEKMIKYCYLEDVDLSYRISRKHNLYYSPFAQCEHLHSSINRQNDFENGKMLMTNHRYLFKKNIPKTPLHLLAFYCSIFFLLFTNLYNGRFTRAKGMAVGLIKSRSL